MCSDSTRKWFGQDRSLFCFYLDLPTHLELILQPHPWWLLLLHMDWFCGSYPPAVSGCFYFRAFIYCVHSIRVTSGFHNKTRWRAFTPFRPISVLWVEWHNWVELPWSQFRYQHQDGAQHLGQKLEISEMMFHSKLVWYDSTIKLPSWDDEHEHASLYKLFDF